MNSNTKGPLPALFMCIAAGLFTAGCDQKQQAAAPPVDSQAATTTAEQSPAVNTMTPELKNEMADMYKKMADCLRTDKSLDECSTDAMKDCPVMQKTGHCPIQEGMGATMGRMGPHDMQDKPSTMGGE